MGKHINMVGLLRAVKIKSTGLVSIGLFGGLLISYGYASAGNKSTLFAVFPLSFVPFVQYAG